MNLEQIDTSTTAGKAEVMRLAAEGRRVAEAFVIASHEGRAKLIDGWHFCQSPPWNWKENVYAIISEPVGPEELFAVVFTKNTGGWVELGEASKIAVERDGKVVKYIRADLAGEGKP